MAGKFDALLPVFTPAELSAEDWRPVRVDDRPFDGYLVSNLGRVQNERTGRVLANLWGVSAAEGIIYWRAGMFEGPAGARVRRIVLVHRVVAEAFVPGRSRQANVVHHIDGTTTNNRAANLAWVSQSDNVRYTWATRREREAAKAYADRYGPESGDGSSASLDDLLADLPPVEPSRYEDPGF